MTFPSWPTHLSTRLLVCSSVLMMSFKPFVRSQNKIQHQSLPKRWWKVKSHSTIQPCSCASLLLLVWIKMLMIWEYPLSLPFGKHNTNIYISSYSNHLMLKNVLALHVIHIEFLFLMMQRVSSEELFYYSDDFLFFPKFNVLDVIDVITNPRLRLVHHGPMDSSISKRSQANQKPTHC